MDGVLYFSRQSMLPQKKPDLVTKLLCGEGGISRAREEAEAAPSSPSSCRGRQRALFRGMIDT